MSSVLSMKLAHVTHQTIGSAAEARRVVDVLGGSILEKMYNRALRGVAAAARAGRTELRFSLWRGGYAFDSDALVAKLRADGFKVRYRHGYSKDKRLCHREVPYRGGIVERQGQLVLRW